MTDIPKHSEKKLTFWGVFWMTASAVIHITAICLIVYFTPLRSWFFQETDPRTFSEIEASKLRKIIQFLLETNADHARELVTEQKEVAARLGEIRDVRFEQFSREAREYDTGSRLPPDMTSRVALGPEVPDTGVDLAKKNLLELYDVATRLDAEIYETYRQWRAVELARIQRLSIGDASQATQVPIPEHQPAKSSVFFANITSLEDAAYKDLQAEVGRIQNELTKMLAEANRMLDTAEELVGDDVGGIITHSPTPYFSITGSGDSGFRNPFEGGSLPDDKVAHTWGVGIGPVVHRNVLLPEEKGELWHTQSPAPGRKLVSGGEASNWMFIDTWYIIGPFPNPGRKNIDHKFAPETVSVIDLDAQYVGKNGRKLRWEFKQSRGVCVHPHYPDDEAIWYAFTEVYSDRDQYRRCIFGCDDYGKVWINGQEVFSSGRIPNPWIPDRVNVLGNNRIHFRKGHNQVLFKLDNAWGNTGFSMCIYVGDT